MRLWNSVSCIHPLCQSCQPSAAAFIMVRLRFTPRNDNKGPRRSQRKSPEFERRACVLRYSPFTQRLFPPRSAPRGKSTVSLLLLMEAELSRRRCIFLHKMYSQCEYFRNTTSDAVVWCSAAQTLLGGIKAECMTAQNCTVYMIARECIN